jgi:predicted glycoside hydrolase/deacetylase ChbG (UPF0249 family)
LSVFASGESSRELMTIGPHVRLRVARQPQVDPHVHPANLVTPSAFARYVLRTAVARRLQPERLEIEIATQLRTFIDAFGRPPDFLDGHQHVQLFPQVRDAFLKVASEGAPRAWVRQCGRARLVRRLHDRKALTLDLLSLGFRGKAKRLGVTVNPAFAGTYAFKEKAKFDKIFPRFLSGLPDGGLIMCHPGFVDSDLVALDSLTTLREQEFAFFNSDAFPKVLADHGMALVRADFRDSA